MVRFPTVDRMINVDQQSGWECPKCGKVNAPQVAACDHKPLVMVNAGICFLGDDNEPVKGGELTVITRG